MPVTLPLLLGLMADELVDDSMSLPLARTVPGTPGAGDPARPATRARIVQSVLNARSLFANIRRRTDALNQALDRFHARKRQIDADTPIGVDSLTDWTRPKLKSA